MSDRGLFICRTVLAVIIAAIMITIFVLSDQDATKSSSLSGTFTEKICEIVVPGFKAKTLTDRLSIITYYNRIVRTYGHFLEFMALGFFVALELSNHERLFVMKGVLSLAFIIASFFSLLYSLTDEVHQIFVPGRSFQIYDIAVDTIGATLGAGIAVLGILVFRRIRRRK